MSRAKLSTLFLLLTVVPACSLPRSVIVGGDMDGDRADGGRLDAAPDGGEDGGSDAGIDGSFDAGMDDVGIDGGADSGLDGGMPDAWTPDPIGTRCTADATCASGFCVDGVCCESACDGACESCTAAADGTCAPAAAGSDPDAECAATAESTCGTTGVCDGARACTLWGTSTVCAPATCTGSTQTNARTCDGAGTCTSRGTHDCAPFSCDGTVCFGSCASDGDCGAGLYCVVATGTCEPRIVDGLGCSANNQCASSHCVDGVCCESACGGTCEACATGLTGVPSGTCAPVMTGTDPGAECASTSAASCGTIGVCDGARACARWPAGTECASPSCGGGMGTLADTCDGAGTCHDNGVVSCSGFACGPTACLTTCSTPGECAVGRYCSAGSCVPLRSNGATCSSAGECSSNFCVDGVCCNSLCSGTCAACTAARKGSGSDGACGLISVGTDPDDECAASAPSTCGLTGTCSGSGSCALYPIGTTCGGSSCSAGTETHPTTCDGAGVCFTPSMTPCSPYVCGGTTCLTTCGGDTDCIAGDYCSAAGACLATQANGATCTGNSQCTSAHCVDGVCCGSACTGTCQSCSVAGSVGMCTNVPASSTDPGTCSGTNACNGAGVCLGASGATCTGDTQCLSNHCIDGVCCNTTCTGTCRACDVAGSVGTCSFVPNGADPDNECLGGFDCNGSGGCG
jgi:hypothetical protein